MALKNNSKTIQEYKIADADRYTLYESINCSAVILSTKIAPDIDMVIKNHKKLVRMLFKANKELRQELLGY